MTQRTRGGLSRNCWPEGSQPFPHQALGSTTWGWLGLTIEKGDPTKNHRGDRGAHPHLYLIPRTSCTAVSQEPRGFHPSGCPLLGPTRALLTHIPQLYSFEGSLRRAGFLRSLSPVSSVGMSADIWENEVLCAQPRTQTQHNHPRHAH